MMDNIKISVIMPVYNSGPFLVPAVESVLSQDFKSFELILVDDGSTDGSSQKCDEIAKADEKVVVIHKKNGGICNARNSALKKARGEFIAFADHDDIYLPKLLSIVYNHAIQNQVDFVKFSKQYEIVKDGKTIRTVQDIVTPKIINCDAYKGEIKNLITEWALDCVWDGLYKSDIIKNNNIFFDESFKRGGEDISFNMRYLCYSKKMETLSEVYYRHFVRQGFSTSSKYHFESIDDQKRLTSVVFEALQKLNFDFSENKDWYAYYLMRNYFCIISANLSSKYCPINYQQKNQIIRDSIKQSFVPNDFFKSKFCAIIKHSKKNALAFFLLKHKMYFFLYSLFRFRSYIPSVNIN